MDIEELGKNWEGFAKEDPLWSIVVRSDKRGGKWDVDQFFQTGKDDIKKIMSVVERQDLAQSGVDASRREVALDFGCGAGRLTQALAEKYATVHGVDIAPSMIELARKHNKHGERCKYHVNVKDDLSLFEDDSFDLVFTYATLQHMQPKYSKKYIKEFLRIVKPGGLVVFQQSDRPTLAEWLKWNMIRYVLKPLGLYTIYQKGRYGTTNMMEMHGIRHDKVIAYLNGIDGKVIHSHLNQVPDKKEGKAWSSYIYIVTK